MGMAKKQKKRRKKRLKRILRLTPMLTVTSWTNYGDSNIYLCTWTMEGMESGWKEGCSNPCLNIPYAIMMYANLSEPIFLNSRQ
mmetsp:Transcript_53962/g.80145  ORF Transcript_53962/g.80145 Transcript_53962/m.80145 type:complete len:84 (+) Transcript_53962:1802-2053(+)